MKNKKPMLILYAVLLLLAGQVNFAYALPNPVTSNESVLYVDVHVDETSADFAHVITNAKVSLAYGSLGEENSLPGVWRDITLDNNQKAVFYDVPAGRVYTISAKAPGFYATEKEFKKSSDGVEYASISLIKAPANATGSVRVAVMVQAPQSPIALTTATINIIKDGKVIAASDTKNTQGKEGVLFENLPIGEYVANITASGYKPLKRYFEIEPNKVTWLPIGMGGDDEDFVRGNTSREIGKPVSVNPISGVSAGGVRISAEKLKSNLVEQRILDAVINIQDDIQEKNKEKRTVYAVTGFKKAKLFLFIPVEIETKISVNGETGAVEKTEKPWWSFLSTQNTKNGNAKLESILYSLTLSENFDEFARLHGLYVKDNKVRVTIELKNSQYKLQPDFGIEESRYQNLLQALIKIDKLLDLANDKNIKFIRQPFESGLVSTTGNGKIH